MCHLDFENKCYEFLIFVLHSIFLAFFIIILVL